MADTSGLLALFNRSDPAHFAVRRAADAVSTLIATPLALTEIHHVAGVRAGGRVADAVLGRLVDLIATTRVVLANVDADLLRSAIEVRVQYADLDLDFVDATCVVVADRVDTDAILTLDRHDFRAVRPLRRYPAFRLLPEDQAG